MWLPADDSSSPASDTGAARVRPLHILFFSDTYRPYVSGVVTSMDIYATELRNLGHKVTVIAPEYPGAVDEPDVVRLPSIPVPGYPKLRLVNPVTKAVHSRLLDLRPDVVHTHSPFGVGRLGVTVARAIGCPVAFTCHSFYEEYTRYTGPLSQPLKPVMRRYLLNYCGDCDVVVAPSQHMRTFLVEIGVEKPVTVLPTGVHPTERPPEEVASEAAGPGSKPATFALAMLGRLSKEKNPELALQTVFELAKLGTPDRDRWRLMVIGDGTERQRLEALAMELGIKRLVAFVGEVTRREVFEYLGLADGMLFTSAVETQGLALLEGMAMRLPVVAVESPALGELVRDGHEGFICAADPVAMAAAVRKLADDPELADRMGQAALERSRAFHPVLLAQRLAGIYRGLRGEERPGACANQADELPLGRS